MNKRTRVIGRLKALFPKANLTKERIDALAARLEVKFEDEASDEEIDTIINNFNESSFTTIEDMAKEDDKLRGLQSRIEKLSKGEKAPDPIADPKEPDDTPKWAIALMQKVDALESGKIADDKKSQAAKAFESSEILKGLKPEVKQRWMSRIDINSEVSYEDQIKDLEVEFTDLVQLSADNRTVGGPPPSGGATPKFTDEQADSIVGDLAI